MRCSTKIDAWRDAKIDAWPDTKIDAWRDAKIEPEGRMRVATGASPW